MSFETGVLGLGVEGLEPRVQRTGLQKIYASELSFGAQRV